jgi:hypothetical protein
MVNRAIPPGGRAARKTARAPESVRPVLISPL